MTVTPSIEPARLHPGGSAEEVLLEARIGHEPVYLTRSARLAHRQFAHLYILAFPALSVVHRHHRRPGRPDQRRLLTAWHLQWEAQGRGQADPY